MKRIGILVASVLVALGAGAVDSSTTQMTFSMRGMSSESETNFCFLMMDLHQRFFIAKMEPRNLGLSAMVGIGDTMSEARKNLIRMRGIAEHGGGMVLPSGCVVSKSGGSLEFRTEDEYEFTFYIPISLFMRMIKDDNLFYKGSGAL